MAYNKTIRLSIKFIDDLVILVVNLESEFELVFCTIRNSIVCNMLLEVFSDDVNRRLLDRAADPESTKSLTDGLHF